ADVYSLGVILYELLVGRVPFKAADWLETVRQAAQQEPVPVRHLQPRTPKDMETICLKCLQKVPGKRYSSALSLAEDLRRVEAGEPIAARPVGRIERSWRWCQRNPVVASLATAVFLVFAAGATVASILAVLADRRASEAITEKAAGVSARNELKKFNDDLRE